MPNRSTVSPHEWQKALWIWHDAYPEGDAYASGWFRYRFDVEAPCSAWLYVTAKGGFVLHLNGVRIAEEESSANYRYDVGDRLRTGTNVIAIFAQCERDTPTFSIPKERARDSVRPVRRTQTGGSPATSISCQDNTPRPKSLPTASLAAKRAAMGR